MPEHYFYIRFFELSIIILLEGFLTIEPLAFIYVLSKNLEKHTKIRFRIFGVIFLLCTKLLILISILKLINLEIPIITLMNFPLSIKNLVLLLGGGFLAIKALFELIEMFLEIKITSSNAVTDYAPATLNYQRIIKYIIFVGSIFAIESVLLTINFSKDLNIITCAMILSMVITLSLGSYLLSALKKHYSIRLVFISFIAVAGVFMFFNALGFNFSINLLYILFLFSFALELLKIKLNKLKQKYSIQISSQ